MNKVIKEIRKRIKDNGLEDEKISVKYIGYKKKFIPVISMECFREGQLAMFFQVRRILIDMIAEYPIHAQYPYYWNGTIINLSSAEITKLNEEWWSCILNGDWQMMEKLLKVHQYEIDINESDNYSTSFGRLCSNKPILSAIRQGNKKMVDMLLKYGASLSCIANPAYLAQELENIIRAYNDIGNTLRKIGAIKWKRNLVKKQNINNKKKGK